VVVLRVCLNEGEEEEVSMDTGAFWIPSCATLTSDAAGAVADVVDTALSNHRHRFSAAHLVYETRPAHSSRV